MDCYILANNELTVYDNNLTQQTDRTLHSTSTLLPVEQLGAARPPATQLLSAFYRSTTTAKGAISFREKVSRRKHLYIKLGQLAL